MYQNFWPDTRVSDRFRKIEILKIISVEEECQLYLHATFQLVNYSRIQVMMNLQFTRRHAPTYNFGHFF